MIVYQRVQENFKFQGGGTDTGDWLINYSGGFVRRGLFGEILLNFNLSKNSIIWGLFTFQLLLIFTIMLFFIFFVKRNNYSLASIALACNPAALLFIGINNAPTRKELLGLATLTIFIYGANFAKKQSRVLVYGSMFMYLGNCLTHEVNVLILPAFIYVIYKNENQFFSPKVTRILYWYLSTVSVMIVFLTIKFHGDTATAKTICSEIVSRGFSPDICLTAIDAIGWPIEFFLAQVRADYPVYFGYFALGGLALLPILSTGWFQKNRKWLIYCFLFILPLFVVVSDYGRWIFVFILEVTLLIMSSAEKLDGGRSWNPVSIILFVLFWGFPIGVGANMPGFTGFQALSNVNFFQSFMIFGHITKSILEGIT